MKTGFINNLPADPYKVQGPREEKPIDVKAKYIRFDLQAKRLTGAQAMRERLKKDAVELKVSEDEMRAAAHDEVIDKLTKSERIALNSAAMLELGIQL